MKKLLRKKLALMLANLKKKRPFYCELEYLENTGTSSNRNWISTWIVPDTTTRWEVRVAFNNTTTGKLMGSGYTAGNRFNIGIESKKFRFAFNGWFDANSNITTPDTNPHTWIMDASTKTFTIDGYSTTTSYTFGASTYPICLFGRCNSASGVTEISNTVVGKIYYSKIWQNGVLVRDMIPVLDWDMTPCMYDKVSKQFFYNQGTGSFTYGREIHYVDYIESSGTQYIDTGHAFTDDFSWEIDFEGLTKGATLFGGRTSSTRTALLYQKSSAQGVETACPIAGMTGDQTPFQLSDLSSNRHKVKMSVSSNKGSVWVDGTQVYNNQSFSGTYISGTTQAIFADNFGSSVSEYTSSKFYGLKMWQGSTLVRDFVPAIDENGVGFVLDKVSHSCYLNAGTGTFATGKIVEPEYE